MMGGNHVYDTHILTPTYLCVEEATPLVKNSLGNIGYEEELTVCLVKETTETEKSALTCHLSKRLGNANATFVIINLLTLTFVT